MESVLVAFSGGVDSTFLLKAARDVLGSRLLAVTAVSPIYPAHERECAVKTAGQLGVKHLTIETGVLDDPRFAANSPQRCYWCKKRLFKKLASLATQRGLRHVVDGTTVDDMQDFRPGTRAAGELGVRSPLVEAGLGKDEIRGLSRECGLATWDMPSCACLASRFPYGVRITEHDLRSVDTAEDFLRGLGLTQVRVRHYRETARIEVTEEEMPSLVLKETRKRIVKQLKKIGYIYVTLDLAGYRSGSMNEILPRPDDTVY